MGDLIDNVLNCKASCVFKQHFNGSVKNVTIKVFCKLVKLGVARGILNKLHQI